MVTELHNVDVDVTGLVEIMGEHLYSSPTVALRELIQNAHDAIRRRQIESPNAFSPVIRMRTDSARGEIALKDNGTLWSFVLQMKMALSRYARKTAQTRLNQIKAIRPSVALRFSETDRFYDDSSMRLFNSWPSIFS